MPTPTFPKRQSPRLQGYDYTQNGAYFVTICTAGRAHLFGRVVSGEMMLSRIGQIAQQEMGKIPEYWQGLVDIDLYVVMPNHVHLIVVLVGTAFLPSDPPFPPFKPADAQKRVPTLGNVIGNYKAGVTRLARQMGYNTDDPVWQGRYHDHIIRSDAALYKIREYIFDNPARWQDDCFY